LISLLALVAPAAVLRNGDGGGGFHPPTVSEFFPGVVLFDGTPFAMTRINLIAVVMTMALAIFFLAAFARPQFVPRGIQNLGEMAVDVVRVNIVEEVMGQRGGRYAFYLTSMFWLMFVFNLTGVIPLMNISVTSVIGVPFLFAFVAWLIFIVQGVRKHGLMHYLKLNLFPPGIPLGIYALVTPIEFISTFILRPVTLTIRLMANMMAGHLLLVLFFSATSFFLLDSDGPMKLFAIPSWVMGFVFTLFELLVALLQAYIFTLLTAVYIDGAISDEH
jgi:F-type H+-transporting ATPase subunit a